MKYLLVLGLIAVVNCAPAPIDSSRDAQITRYESDNIGVDGYRFA